MRNALTLKSVLLITFGVKNNDAEKFEHVDLSAQLQPLQVIESDFILHLVRHSLAIIAHLVASINPVAKATQNPVSEISRDHIEWLAQISPPVKHALNHGLCYEGVLH